MNINVNDILSKIVGYLSEALITENVKFEATEDASDVLKLTSMITDIRFQIDFTLMSSAVEIQELYDKYRNRPTEESNIEIRTLMDLAGYIHILVNDEYEALNHVSQWERLISRLVKLLILHSAVVLEETCQDESITNGMSYDEWNRLLKANPWLVAAVCIRLIAGYYILDMTLNKMEIEHKENDNETRGLN